MDQKNCNNLELVTNPFNGKPNKALSLSISIEYLEQ